MSLNFLLKFSLPLFLVMLSSLTLKLIILLNSLGLIFLSNNSLDKNLLILIDVTLGQQVELLIHMSLDLSRRSVFLKKSSESSLPSDPKDFLRHSGISTTSSLTNSHMSSFSLFSESLKSSESRVDLDISLSDHSVFDEASDVESGRGSFYLNGFFGVNPNSVLSALQN